MLLCDGGQRCQDDFCNKEREGERGGMKISLELMNALSKTFQIYEHSPFRCERKEERRIH